MTQLDGLKHRFVFKKIKQLSLSLCIDAYTQTIAMDLIPLVLLDELDGPVTLTKWLDDVRNRLQNIKVTTT